MVMCSVTSPALTLTQNIKEKKGKLLKTSQNPFWSLDSNFSWFFFFSNYWIQGQPVWGQPGVMEGIPAHGRVWAV